MTLFNSGKTIEAAVKPGQSANRIEFKGKRYELLQLHFHAPSEHTIDGHRGPIEMHLVHRLSDDDLAVIGVILEPGDTNKNFCPIWDHLPPSRETPAREIAVDPANLLPEDRSFTYTMVLLPHRTAIRW